MKAYEARQNTINNTYKRIMNTIDVFCASYNSSCTEEITVFREDVIRLLEADGYIVTYFEGDPASKIKISWDVKE